MAAADFHAQVQQMYISYYGRPADPAGLAFWADQFDKSTDLTQALAAFGTSQEYTDNFGGLTNAQLIDNLYQQMFNRAPDDEGKAFYLARLDAGEATLASIAKQIGDGASGSDKTALDNKAEVAQEYTNKVTELGATYDSTKIAAAKSILAAVTDDAATVTSGKTAADAEVANNVPNPGQTFTLTTGVDTFTGGDGDDTFNAALLTVNDGDTLDGAAGKDTLNMEINANVTDKFKSSNIENVNVTAFGAHTVDMKNITGVETLTTKGSTGLVTLNNVGSATMALGFDGSTTNQITANYTAGVLDGTNDVLNVKLNDAKGVAVTTSAGFESAKITATGSSDIDTFTAPGVTTLVMEGSGNVNAKNTLAGISTLTATSMTGALTTGTVQTNGFVNQNITAHADGASLLLGSGADNIGFQNTNATAKASTVKLGAGDDKLLLDVTGAGAVYVFGEAGDDHVRLATSTLTTNDLIDLGAGTDTLTLAVGGANTLVLRGVENLNLTSAATGTQTINSSDTALAVTANVNGLAVDLADLVAGSTVKVQTEAAATTTTAGAVTVGFKNAEATSTIDIASGMTGALTLDKITNATVNLGAASAMAASTITTTSTTTDLTINATGAMSTTGAVASGDNKLAKVTITGTDAVTTGAMTSTGLTDVTMTAAKGLTVGALAATGTKLTNVSLTSTTDAVVAGTIGKTDNANTLAVTINAAKNITQTGLLDSTKIGDISAVSTGGTASLAVGSTIGANATTMGDLTITGKTDAITTTVGTTANLATLGTVAMTATDGKVGLVAVNAKDTGGITVNLSAKTFIDDGTGNGTSAAVVTNVGGAITASLAGAAKAAVNYDGKTVNLTATNTGGLTSTIDNNATAGDGSTSTVTLGNAKSGQSNAVTFTGTVDTLNVTGGTGIDNIKIDADDVKTGTIALGTGADILDFSTTAAGVAVNLGSTTVTFNEGTANVTTIAAGKAQKYAATADKKIVADGFNFTVSGVSEVVGSGAADYIVANASGTKITGGAGADAIVLGAGVDTVVYTTLTDSLVTGNGTTKAGIDTVVNFKAGTDKIDVATAPAAAANVKTVTQAWNTDWDTTMAAAYAAASGGAMAANDVLVMTLTGTNAGTYLVINDGTAGWLAAADAVIELTGLDGTIAHTDFM